MGRDSVPPMANLVRVMQTDDGVVIDCLFLFSLVCLPLFETLARIVIHRGEMDIEQLLQKQKKS